MNCVSVKTNLKRLVEDQAARLKEPNYSGIDLDCKLQVEKTMFQLCDRRLKTIKSDRKALIIRRLSKRRLRLNGPVKVEWFVQRLLSKDYQQQSKANSLRFDKLTNRLPELIKMAAFNSAPHNAQQRSSWTYQSALIIWMRVWILLLPNKRCLSFFFWLRTASEQRFIQTNNFSNKRKRACDWVSANRSEVGHWRTSGKRGWSICGHPSSFGPWLIHFLGLCSFKKIACTPLDEPN